MLLCIIRLDLDEMISSKHSQKCGVSVYYSYWPLKIEIFIVRIVEF